jgi:hypothetical protein
MRLKESVEQEILNKYIAKMNSSDKGKCYRDSYLLAQKLNREGISKDKILFLCFGQKPIRALMHSCIMLLDDLILMDFERYSWKKEMYPEYFIGAITFSDLENNNSNFFTKIDIYDILKNFKYDYNLLECNCQNNGLYESEEPIVCITEQETPELGLVMRKNLDELLNDPELHSYFATPENFDKFYANIVEFFKTDVLTVNKLKEYLNNLNYGPKTIDLSCDILSKNKDKEEKNDAVTNKEKKVEEMTIIPSSVNSIIKSQINQNKPEKEVNTKKIPIIDKSSKFQDILNKQIFDLNK